METISHANNRFSVNRPFKVKLSLSEPKKNGKRKCETSETEGGKFKEPEGTTKTIKTPFPESV